MGLDLAAAGKHLHWEAGAGSEARAGAATGRGVYESMWHTGEMVDSSMRTYEE